MGLLHQGEPPVWRMFWRTVYWIIFRVGFGGRNTDFFKLFSSCNQSENNILFKNMWCEWWLLNWYFKQFVVFTGNLQKSNYLSIFIKLCNLQCQFFWSIRLFFVFRCLALFIDLLVMMGMITLSSLWDSLRLLVLKKLMYWSKNLNFYAK